MLYPFTNIALGENATVAAATYLPVASSSIGQVVTFSIVASNPVVCAIAGATNVISFVGAGTCEVRANAASNTLYEAAFATQIIPVFKGSQTVSITSSAPSPILFSATPYTPVATATSGLPVSFTSGNSSVCTQSGGVFTFVGAGTCVVQADQGGDVNYNPAARQTQSFSVAKAPQTVTFVSATPADPRVGVSFTVSASATSGLTVTYVASGTCVNSGNRVNITAPGGNCTVTASQAGNSNYESAQAVQTFPTLIGEQTISFTSSAPTSPTVTSTFTPTAVALPSGLSVTFTVTSLGDPPVCSISAGVVTFDTVGVCTIVANQAGNSNYNPAPTVTLNVGVGLNGQTINITSTAPSAATVLGDSYLPSATASSSLQVTYSVSASSFGVCSASAGGVVSFVGIGTCEVQFDQSGNATFNAAPRLTQSFSVAGATQTVTFISSPGTTKVGGTRYAPIAASSVNGLLVTISSTTPAVCTYNGLDVSFLTVGTCVLNANQAGNAQYLPSSDQQNFPVTIGDQSISFNSAAPQGAVVNGSTYTVDATSSSGLTVTLSLTGASAGVCSLSGSVVSFLSTGSCGVKADQAGNSNYAPAPTGFQTFNVFRGTQTLTFGTPVPSAAVVGDTFTPSASSSVTGVVPVLSVAPSAVLVCSFDSQTGVVTMIGVGTCAIAANADATRDFNAAVQILQSFTVGKGSQTVSFLSSPPVGAAVGGTAAVSFSSSSGLPAQLSVSPATVGNCSVVGTQVRFLATGTCTLLLDQAGDNNYNPATQVSQSFTISKGPQTLSFLSQPPGNVAVGVTYTVVAVSTSGLIVDVTSSSQSICTIANNVVSFLFPGQCTLNANQAGDVNFNPANQVSQTFGVGLASQTVSFTSTNSISRVVAGPTYTPTATATSNLPVTILLDPSSIAICTISGGVVSFIGVGNCAIIARQSGNQVFNAAPDQVQNLPVGKGSQTISVGPLPVSPAVAGPSFRFNTTSSAGLPVTLTSTTTSICTVSNLVVSFVGAGTCSINANQPGTDLYNAAPQVPISFAVAKGDQSLTISRAPQDASVSGATYTPTATSSSGLPVTISSASPLICTISGGIVSFVAAGTCQLSAVQPGDANYNPVSGLLSFTVNLGSQTVAFTSNAPGGAFFMGPGYTPSASATPSGLPVTITVDSSSSTVCSRQGSGVLFIGVGTCTLNANQGGSANYVAAAQVQQSFNVAKSNQVVSFTSPIPTSASVQGAQTTLSGNATSGLTPTFASQTAVVCTVQGVTVTYISVGTCTLAISQSGNENYNAAPVVTQTFSVVRGTQVISFDTPAPASAVFGQTYTPTVVARPSLLTVSVVSGNTSVCTISSGIVSFVSVGVCVLNANQAGNTNYNPAAQVTQSFGVGLAPQSITITSTAPSSAVVGGPNYTPSATATVTPVSITVDAGASSICSIVGGIVSHIGFGTCILRFRQNGNANFNAAQELVQSYSVGKGTQTVTFGTTQPANAVVAGPTYAVTASSSVAGLPVVLSVAAGSTNICTLSSGIVSFSATGTCRIDAVQAGTQNWNSASNFQSFTVSRGSQTISVTSVAPGNARVAESNYILLATSSAGLPVSFALVTGVSACSLSGSTVTFVVPGTCSINFTQSGNGNYNPAPFVIQTFTVSKGPQTIAFTSIAPTNAVVAGTTYTVSASLATPSNLAGTFSIDPGASTVCTLSGSVVSFVKAGICRVNLDQAGSTSYIAAPQVQQSFTVGKGTQTVSFSTTPAPTNRVGDPIYRVNASATPSGLPVTFSSATPVVCEVNTNRVSFLSVGTCTVRATQSGNSDWNATSRTQSFAVSIGLQTLNFTSPVDPVVLLGTTYNPVALSTAPRVVNITVDPLAAGICSISASGQVTNLNVGRCILVASQAGDAFYAPAPSITQNYTIATVQFFSSLPQLFNCATPSECAGNVSGIFFDQFATEANLSASITQAENDRTASNCSQSVWLQLCNYVYVNRLFSINANRVANLDVVLVNSSAYNSSCITSGCRDIIGVVFATYRPIAQSAAIVCTTPLCRSSYLRSTSSAVAVSNGVPNAMQAEKDRFDLDIQSETNYDLYVRTSAFAACSTDVCQQALYSDLNTTYAIANYVQRAYSLGLQVRNETRHKEVVAAIDGEFAPCTTSMCNSSDFASILSRKRAYFAVMVQWNNRLNALAANCSGSCNQTAMIAARSTAQESM